MSHSHPSLGTWRALLEGAVVVLVGVVVFWTAAASSGQAAVSSGQATVSSGRAATSSDAAAGSSGSLSAPATRPALGLERPTPVPSGPVPFQYDLHTFRGGEGNTTVVAAVAVQVRELRRERRDGEIRYRFDVRFVLADTAVQRVIDTIDSVYVGVPRPLARRHLLHTAIELEAPPSETTHQRIVVTDAGRPGYGQLEQSDFPIPDYSGTELMLSDIAFGLPGVRGAWTRRGVTLALLPTSQFPESAFDLYYEVYNLPPGRSYQTELAIQPVDEDSENEDRIVRTRFEGESDAGPDGILGELRRVESALEEGRYRVTVTVTDGVDGRTATSSRTVEVRGWRRGTTMVPALPKRGTVVGGR